MPEGPVRSAIYRLSMIVCSLPNKKVERSISEVVLVADESGISATCLVRIRCFAHVYPSFRVTEIGSTAVPRAL